MSANAEVFNLIGLGFEGGYWDFKEQWHENNATIVHDILCLSNNLENRDAYLIFGVSDTGDICGVVMDDTNRKTSAMLNDMLSHLSFGGDYKPLVKVETITIRNVKIEYIKIFNSNKTPFFLKNDYKDRQKVVKANHIYTRVGDKNTPIDKSADYDKQEYLWRKRFGIDLPIIDKLNLLLDDLENWGTYTSNSAEAWKSGADFGNEDIVIHRYFPEFSIKKVGNYDDRHSFECEGYCDFYLDPIVSFVPIEIYYLSTLVYKTKLSFIDSRLFIPTPLIGRFNNPKGWSAFNSASDAQVSFYYYIKDSLEGRLLRLLTSGTYNVYSRFETAKTWLILFENHNEMDDFLEFANKNPDLYDDTLKSVCYGVPKAKVLPAYDSKYILQTQHFLSEFRKSR